VLTVSAAVGVVDVVDGSDEVDDGTDGADGAVWSLVPSAAQPATTRATGSVSANRRDLRSGLTLPRLG
jgi:hypothetical protein